MFTVRVKRNYILKESGEVEMEADTAADALAKAKAEETDGAIEPDWSEDDGRADVDSYEWDVVAPNGVVVLTETGTNDLKETPSVARGREETVPR